MIKILLSLILFLFINNYMDTKYNTVYDLYHKVHNYTSKIKNMDGFILVNCILIIIAFYIK